MSGPQQVGDTGCGACGDGCADRPGCRVAEESPSAQVGEVQGDGLVASLVQIMNAEYDGLGRLPADVLGVLNMAAEALAARQPGAQGPKFTTEDGPCWHHAGKAFIVTVDGDTLQLMVADGPRIEFIGDSRPYRVPAQGIDLGQLRKLADHWERTTNDKDVAFKDRELIGMYDNGLMKCVRELRAALIDQRDAAPGVKP